MFVLKTNFCALSVCIAFISTKNQACILIDTNKELLDCFNQLCFIDRMPFSTRVKAFNMSAG